MKKYKYYYHEPVNSIVELVDRSQKLYADCVAVRYKKKRAIYEKSYNELYRDSKNTARFLLSQNLEKGHIAILGQPTYEWIIAYLGVAYAGMVVVPLDKDLSTEDLYSLICHADVDCLFYDEQYSDIYNKLITEYSFNKMGVSLSQIGEFDTSEINLPNIDPDRLFAIMFTSGTTGTSKGVMLSQRNIARNTTQGLSVANFNHGKDVMLSVLPFTHAYGFTCTILAMIYKGIPTCICSGIKYIKRDLIDFKPTLMFVVPLMAQKLFEGVEIAVKNQNKEKQFHKGMKISKLLNKINIDVSDKIFKEVKQAFGGNLRVLVCGGAPLAEELIENYSALGITLFQGYGLTECSPMLSVNFDHYHKVNSVGRVVEGNYAKIVDGEVWASGVSISNGYYNDSEETEKSFQDGWFKTGDLGTIDKDGFIFLTGRKKNLIILPNGENVSAEELENFVYSIPTVAEALVYGHQNSIVAEIYLDPEQPQNEESVRIEIMKINKKLPSYKNIDNVVFRTTPFEKTTTQKIKRYKYLEERK